MRLWLKDLGPRGASLYSSRSSSLKSISKCTRLVEAIVPVFLAFACFSDPEVTPDTEDCRDCDCDCGVGDRDLGRGEDACDSTGDGDFVGVETWLSRDANPRVPWSNLVVGLRMR
jgi:hypothetical protein